MVGIAQNAVLMALLALIGLLPAAAAARMPPLEELEGLLPASRAMQLLERRLASETRALEAQNAGLGTKLWSQLSYVDGDEVVDIGRSRPLRQLGAGAGLRLPVLGSRLQETDARERREIDLARVRAETELERRALLARLRTAYAEYWAAQRLVALADALLEEESRATLLLAHRTEAALLLDSDRLSLLGAFAAARRDRSAAQLARDEALHTLRSLVDAEITAGVAPPPRSPGLCEPTELEPAAMELSLEEHPEIVYLRRAAALLGASGRSSPLYGVSSEVRVGWHAVRERADDTEAGSAVISWHFEIPLRYSGARRLQSSSVAAEAARAELEHELRRAELAGELQLVQARVQLAQTTLEAARVGLAARDAALREKELRAAALEGDVLEQLQAARIARYGSARGAVEAELAALRARIDWARRSAGSCPTVAGRRALYVWSSAPLLEALDGSADAAGALRELQAAGIDRLLLSLDGTQLERFGRDPDALHAAVLAAQRAGFRVELLLGEPEWLLAEQRPQLMRIVRAFAARPFDGLHLDIEPAQLVERGHEPSALAAALVETLTEVTAATPLPVSLSVHPRDLDLRVGGTSVARHLERLRVAPTAMIYVANAERAAELAQSLLERHPQLVFRVALSLEESLSREESLHHLPPEERRRRMEAIETRLAGRNFAGLALQTAPSWYAAGTAPGDPP